MLVTAFGFKELIYENQNTLKSAFRRL